MRKRTDGLGGQLWTLFTLIQFAERFNLKVLCDMRAFSYFLGSNSYYATTKRITDEVVFHPRIIYELEHIESIPEGEVLDWNNINVQHAIMEWFSQSSIQSKPHFTNPFRNGAQFVYRSFIDLITSVDAASQSEHVECYMPIQVRDKSMIEEYKPRVQNSISIHGRAGNGEQDMLPNLWNSAAGVWKRQKQNDTGLKRISATADSFISEMEQYDGDFFVCTDTLAFFNKITDQFGSRAFSIDRDWLPAGWGPGHNINYHPYSSEFREQWESNPIDPWKLLCTDLIDMELMCYSKRLICSSSQFNQIPRQLQPFTELH